MDLGKTKNIENHEDNHILNFYNFTALFQRILHNISYKVSTTNYMEQPFCT